MAGTVSSTALAFTMLGYLSTYLMAGSYHISLLEKDAIAEDDTNLDSIISINYCSENYPYTYFKCLSLCSSDLNATCLDDQLCYCNEQINTPKEPSGHQRHRASNYFGTGKDIFCLSSDFCEDLCKYDEKLTKFAFAQEQLYSTTKVIVGAMCNFRKNDYREAVESCVCALI